MYLGPHKSAVEAGGGSPPPQASPGVSAPPADVPGSAAAPPAASPVISWETAPKELRSQYETTKAEAERLKAEQEQWGKLGDREQVSKVYGAHSERLAKATDMGKSLGYTEQQIRDAMMDDPKGTLAFLQQEYTKPAPTTREALDKQLKEMLEAEVKPIRERMDETVNREANALYESERDRLYKAEFADGLPDENREELFEILDSMISSDQAALARLKFQKQTSDIARHMTAAKALLVKRHNAYIGHERKRSGGDPPPPKPGEGKPNGKALDVKLSSGVKVRDLLAY